MGRSLPSFALCLRAVLLVCTLVAGLLLGACSSGGSAGPRSHSSGGAAPGPSTPAPNCGLTYDRCDNNKACCSGLCVGGECSCLGIASKCQNDAPCCEDFACNQGKCTPLGCRADGAACKSGGLPCCSGACIGGTCGPPRCKASGEGCLENNDCCEGLSCNAAVGAHGTCEPGCAATHQACGGDSVGPFCCSGNQCLSGTCLEFCKPLDFQCKSSNECCDGLACTGGHCRPCGGPSSTCKSTTDCCAGTCNGGKCSSCVSKRDPLLTPDDVVQGACSTDADCCARLHCSGGFCNCSDELGSCQSDNDCCSGLTCHNGHCGTLDCIDIGAPDAPPNPAEPNACSGCCSGRCDADDTICGGLEKWTCDPAHGCSEGNYCDATGSCHNCDQPQKVYACTSNDQCCSRQCEEGHCCGGVSTVPGPQVTCGDQVCCGGMTCCADSFPPYCAQSRHSQCKYLNDCCPPYQCNPNSGTCE